jgi:hypothetical protein
MLRMTCGFPAGGRPYSAFDSLCCDGARAFSNIAGSVKAYVRNMRAKTWSLSASSLENSCGSCAASFASRRAHFFMAGVTKSSDRLLIWRLDCSPQPSAITGAGLGHRGWAPSTWRRASQSWSGRTVIVGATQCAGLTELKPQHHSNPTAGMYRFETSSGKQRSSSYITFRTISEGSPGWILPARTALHIARDVGRWTPLRRR